jgi:NAD(P)-dependent dehydrogenase (short-subunit alcohol dehydrogenase family)
MPMAERGAAVVTGAGRGIGRAAALELARLGHRVGLLSRTEGELLEVRDAIEALGVRALHVVGDVTDSSSIETLVRRAEEELGSISVAVAAAGRASSAPILKTPADELRRAFEINCVAAFSLVQAAAQAMIRGRVAGRIVIVASTAAVKGLRYTSAYSASKHAVLGLVRCAALELASAGIAINALCPGWVETRMFDEGLANIAEKTRSTVEEARRKIEATIPMGRVLHTREVAAALRFLVSEEASQMTGQALVLDGGTTL